MPVDDVSLDGINWGGSGGETAEMILASFPYLELEDIQEALRYASALVDWQELDLTA